MSAFEPETALYEGASKRIGAMLRRLAPARAVSSVAPGVRRVPAPRPPAPVPRGSGEN